MKLDNWIGGRAVPPAAGEYLDNIDPKTGRAVGQVASSGADDVDLAVRAARGAPVLPLDERCALLEALADAAEKRLPELAELEALDTGKLLSATESGDVPRAIANLRFFAQLARTISSDCHPTEDALNYTLRQPLGVVATITPWNFPIVLFTWKVAPAIAMGNAVIAKPSELTPSSANLLARLFSEVGAPAGLLNVVNGTGPEAGEPLATHPYVKAISFTGGTQTGRLITGLASPLLKKVSLELGGKNPSVVFADCDFERAVEGVARAAFFNTGQVCLCGSRVLVEASIHDAFVDALVAQAARWIPEENLGSLISAEHRRKVEGYVKLAREEGGRVACGGERAGPEGGAFFAPTVITGLPIESRAAQEEIFGPVVSVHPFEDEEQALESANAVEYGLASSIWTNDLTRAHRVAARIESGMVWINTWNKRDLRVPFGGMKQSGVGREGGRYSLEFFSQDRNICVQL